jgi:hypothetical protein
MVGQQRTAVEVRTAFSGRMHSQTNNPPHPGLSKLVIMAVRCHKRLLMALAVCLAVTKCCVSLTSMSCVHQGVLPQAAQVQLHQGMHSLHDPRHIVLVVHLWVDTVGPTHYGRLASASKRPYRAWHAVPPLLCSADAPACLTAASADSCGHCCCPSRCCVCRAFQDRCPHRLAPLSEGIIDAQTGHLYCSYHGCEYSPLGALHLCLDGHTMVIKPSPISCRVVWASSRGGGGVLHTSSAKFAHLKRVSLDHMISPRD